jgi:hypothetical protein
MVLLMPHVHESVTAGKELIGVLGEPDAGFQILSLDLFLA